ncbi:MAG: hypothetical protein JWP91_438 [Fibrobacteres bacterium]|nr:hypothetical protein [Fibrobacterota bacterium]
MRAFTALHALYAGLALTVLPLMVPGKASAAGAASRFFHAPAGHLTTAELPPDFRAVIRSIRFDRKDAFDGSVAHSDLERKVFRLGNRIHIESREATVRRRLLFREGDSIGKDLLSETERTLRAEEFLSDAIVTVKPLDGGACEVLVTTYDQWTTVLAAGARAQNLGAADLLLARWSRIKRDEWYWVLGAFETNLMGTGTKVGASISRDPVRSTRALTFTNNNLTSQQLQVSGYAAWLSDGDSVVFRINKPLLSRTDRYAYGLTLTSQENSERIYFDANALGRLPDPVAKDLAGAAQLVRVFDRVATQQVEASALRSFGKSLKFNLGPDFYYRDRYPNGGLGKADSAVLPYAALPSSALAPETRTDAVLGAVASLYQYGYRTSRNFRNLKWSESVETGWRLTTKAGINQEWLGAGDADFRLVQEGAYAGFWADRAYVNTAIAWQSFLSPSGDFADGQVDALGETALREHRLTATWLTASWTHLFATPRSGQLTLGELNGLTGYPSWYYAGQARFVASAEQRLFPEWEWLTMVPAFAAFVNAGNAFPSARDFDPADLHWSVGLGLRLGRSKSTTKAVQHISIALPLGDDFLTGPTLSILAKKTL